MVTCAGWNCSAESCRYELQCAVDPPGDSYFYWSYNNQPVNEGSEWVVERQHTEDPDLLPYTCTAQNPVSKRNTTVFPSALCAGESTRRMHTLGMLRMCWGCAGDRTHPAKGAQSGALPMHSLLSPLPCSLPCATRKHSQHPC